MVQYERFLFFQSFAKILIIAMLKLFNTLTRKKEIFKPLRDKKVGLYTCGPTVYWHAHIGNLRTYIFEDILKRILIYNGYKVKHVMNITDVGHLTSDEDTGEDKVEKAAREKKMDAWKLAEFYTKAFKKDLQRLNIIEPEIWCKATDHIKEQIDLIRKLEKKGYTYIIEDGVYFDTSKLKDYGKLAGLRKVKQLAGARVEVVPGKKNPADFALWKFTPPGVKRQMEWDSPWGRGFPGWHIECSAMSMKYLGETFDIHCGGVDHIPVHHTNEIAQAEAATGKAFVKYWLHGAFLVLKEGRMGKSEGNIITLEDLVKRGFHPLAFRYLCLTAHYRKRLVFSWENLEAAQRGLESLVYFVQEIYQKNRLKRKNRKIRNYQKKFLEFINDDLNIPRALSLAWQVSRDKNLSQREKYFLLSDFDKIFGLRLNKVKPLKISKQVQKLLKKREVLRKEKKWQEADKIREQIQKLGYLIEDTPKGPKLKARLEKILS